MYKLDEIGIEGRNILIVEDMIDTGFTMSEILRKVRDCQPKKLKVAVAFHKKIPEPEKERPIADFTGFLFPELFCIGYGMDYNGLFRDLPHICRINQNGVENFMKLEDKTKICGTTWAKLKVKAMKKDYK